MKVGSNAIPSSAVLISATVPLNTIDASAVPSPVVNVRPTTPFSVRTPLVDVSVISRSAPPASISVIEIALPPPLENVSGLSSSTDCAIGMLLIGASSTALTVIATVWSSLSGPPLPVLPRSLVTICTLAAPL